MENKLAKLRGGVTLVRPEECKAVEETFSEKLSQWRKRKRMFKDLWDTLTENSPKDPKEFKVFSFLFLSVCVCVCMCVSVMVTIFFELFSGGAWNRI